MVAAPLQSGMRFLPVAVALAMMAACTTPKHDWVVEPGVRVGPITASSSALDLRKAFGDSNVADKDIDIGEGVTEPGTDIYETMPGKRLAVLWKDLATRKTPAKVIICYQWTQGDCMWRTSNGIGINSSLKDLERLNGRPFNLLGFGWDLAGTVFSWDSGNLASLIKGGLILRLTPGEAGTSSEEYQTVLGEGQFLSSLPAMQKLNPTAYQMEMEFR
jgi:hypothetical protein